MANDLNTHEGFEAECQLVRDEFDVKLEELKASLVASQVAMYDRIIDYIDNHKG